MIYRLLRMAIEGLTDNSGGDTARTTKIVAIACLAAVAGLIIFRVACPDAARAALNVLRFLRHIH